MEDRALAADRVPVYHGKAWSLISNRVLGPEACATTPDMLANLNMWMHETAWYFGPGVGGDRAAVPKTEWVIVGQVYAKKTKLSSGEKVAMSHSLLSGPNKRAHVGRWLNGGKGDACYPQPRVLREPSLTRLFTLSITSSRNLHFKDQKISPKI